MAAHETKKFNSNSANESESERRNLYRAFLRQLKRYCRKEDIGRDPQLLTVPTAAVSCALHEMGISESMVKECFTYLVPRAPNYLNIIPLQKWLDSNTSRCDHDAQNSSREGGPNEADNSQTSLAFDNESNSTRPAAGKNYTGMNAPRVGSKFQNLRSRNHNTPGYLAEGQAADDNSSCFGPEPSESQYSTASGTAVRKTYEWWTEGRVTTDQFLDDLRDHGLYTEAVSEKLRQNDFTRGLSFAQVRRLTLDRERENESVKYSCGPRKHKQCFKTDESGYRERNCNGNLKKPLYGWTDRESAGQKVGGNPYGHHFFGSEEDSSHVFGQRVNRGDKQGLRIFSDKRIGHETEAEQSVPSRKCFEGIRQDRSPEREDAVLSKIEDHPTKMHFEKNNKESESYAVPFARPMRAFVDGKT